MEKEATLSSLWPIVVVIALATFIVVMLLRPCETYRVRTTLTHSEFGWSNTVAYPSPYGGCQCTTVGDDPWTMSENDPRPKRQSDVLRRPKITNEVVF